MSATKQMTVSKKELLDLEKGFWTGDAAYYAAHADAECLVAFPQMAQAISNADLAKTASKPHRWRDLDIDVKGMILDPFCLFQSASVARSGRKVHLRLPGGA